MCDTVHHMNSALAPLPNEERWECTSCRGPPLTNCKTGFSSPNQPSNQRQPADMIWGLFSVSKTLRFYSQSTAAAAKGKGTPLQVQHAVLTGANQINIMCILYSLPGNRYKRMLKCSWCKKTGGGSGWEESPPIESSFPRVKEVHSHCHIVTLNVCCAAFERASRKLWKGVASCEEPRGSLRKDFPLSSDGVR